MVQLGGFLGRLLGRSIKTGLPLMKNILKPLGLTAAASATDAAIQKKILIKTLTGMHPSDLAKQTTLIISNEEIDDIVKIVKSLEDAGSLNKKVDFLGCY